MILRLTVCGLVIVLIVVIGLSYYSNREGFETITEVKKNTIIKDVNQLDMDKNKVANDTSALLVSDHTVIPERNDIIPEIKLSESGYNAMDLQQKINVLKDIQKVVKNDLILNRNLLNNMDSNKNRSNDSISIQQGKEYENGCEKQIENDCYQDTEYRCPKNPDGSCPPLPDMTKYIKKDSIPCWGCNIDY